MYRQAFLVTARSFTRARSSHKLLRVVAIARQHACVSVYSVACVTNDEMHACVCDHANVRDAYNHAPSISRPRCFHTIRPYQNVRMRLCLYRIFLCLLPLFAFPSPVCLSLSLSLSLFLYSILLFLLLCISFLLPLASCLLLFFYDLNPSTRSQALFSTWKKYSKQISFFIDLYSWRIKVLASRPDFSVRSYVNLTNL